MISVNKALRSIPAQLTLSVSWAKGSISTQARTLIPAAARPRSRPPAPLKSETAFSWLALASDLSWAPLGAGTPSSGETPPVVRTADSRTVNAVVDRTLLPDFVAVAIAADAMDR